jgi:hypothetical protein
MIGSDPRLVSCIAIAADCILTISYETVEEREEEKCRNSFRQMFQDPRSAMGDHHKRLNSRRGNLEILQAVPGASIDLQRLWSE